MYIIHPKELTVATITSANGTNVRTSTPTSTSTSFAQLLNVERVTSTVKNCKKKADDNSMNNVTTNRNICMYAYTAEGNIKWTLKRVGQTSWKGSSDLDQFKKIYAMFKCPLNIDPDCICGCTVKTDTKRWMSMLLRKSVELIAPVRYDMNATIIVTITVTVTVTITVTVIVTVTVTTTTKRKWLKSRRLSRWIFTPTSVDVDKRGMVRYVRVAWARDRDRDHFRGHDRSLSIL